MAAYLKKIQGLDKTSRYMVYGTGAFFVWGQFYGSYLRSQEAKHPKHTPEPIKVTAAPAAAASHAPVAASSVATGGADITLMLKDIQSRLAAIEKKL